LKLNDITRKRYKDALNDLKGQGYSDSTMDGIHRNGRVIFRKALEQEIIKKDPTENAYLKKNRKTIKQLEYEEVPNTLKEKNLLCFLIPRGNRGLFRLLDVPYSFIPGIREGELVALKWKDVDFNNHTISITKTYYNPTKNTSEYQLVTPKTRKSRRKIIVDEMVISALKDHKNFQQEVIKRLGDLTIIKILSLPK
jgi:integrase